MRSPGTKPSTSLRVRSGASGTYGKATVTAFVSSHHNWASLLQDGSDAPLLQHLGYTQLLDNPDSWEGWHWGSMHLGWYWRFGQSDCFDMLARL